MAGDFKMRLAKGILDISPKLVSKPLGLLPFMVKSQLIERILTLILAQQQQDDELAFLNDRHIGIKVIDLSLSFEVTFDGNCWRVAEFKTPEVTFSALSSDLLLIAAGKEDPDTLFFQRKLNIEGDTELGLEVKNLLLSVEFDSLPRAISLSIAKLAQALTLLRQNATPQMQFE